MDGDEPQRTASGLRVMEPALTISAVERRTGIPQATLRAWESRYGLAPSRVTAGGHRRYTPADVARLRSVQHLVARGVPAGEAARSVLSLDGESQLPHLDLPPGTGRWARELATAVIDLDGPATRALLREHLAAHGVLVTWDTVLRPVLAAIGGQWTEVPHGVAAEHMLSHIATVVLGESVRRPPGVGDRNVLLACVPGELHDLPLHALWAALDVTRAEAILLGARTPVDSLAASVELHRPDLVVMFCLLPEFGRTEVLEQLDGPVPLVAAGPGWSGAALPGGVEHVDDLLGATEVVTKLL
jgi:DNA-binding transcriptional MerR regulator